VNFGYNAVIYLLVPTVCNMSRIVRFAGSLYTRLRPFVRDSRSIAHRVEGWQRHRPNNPRTVKSVGISAAETRPSSKCHMIHASVATGKHRCGSSAIVINKLQRQSALDSCYVNLVPRLGGIVRFAGVQAHMLTSARSEVTAMTVLRARIVRTPRPRGCLTILQESTRSTSSR
jgi:hypothetical protein